MGAIIALFNLSFNQCLAVAILGPASYFLVGIVSVASKIQGDTTLSLSKQTLGIKGNIIPNLIAWLNFLGWLIVNVVTSALILLSIFAILGIETSTFLTIFCILIIVFISSLCCLVSEKALATIQQYLTIIFGGATLLILAYLLFNADFSSLYQR